MPAQPTRSFPPSALARVLVLSLVVVQCTAADDDVIRENGAVMDDGTAGPAAGLAALVGVTPAVGLDGMDGFSTRVGLGTEAGLSSTDGLMATEAGRRTAAYLVRCALPPDRTITKTDAAGTVHEMTGQLGMWPSWEWGSCDGLCQEQISACLLAHLNTTGSDIALWLDSDSAAIGWGRSPSFPRQEASFFGNVFQSPPRAFYCDGGGFEPGVAARRIGADQPGAPVKNAFPGATCSQRCSSVDDPNRADGFRDCLGFAHVVTVWRQ